MGVTIAGVHSDDHSIAVSIRTRPMIAEKRQVSDYVVGKDGKIHIEDGYNDGLIELECKIGDYDRAARQTQARGIAAWLDQTPPFVFKFDDEPDLEYVIVKTANNVVQMLEGYTDSFLVRLECKPFKRKNHKTPLQTITGADTIAVTNDGTKYANPVFTLTGTAATITIDTFTYTGLSSETVYVDCERKLVYAVSGDTKINKIQNFSGTFTTIQPGSGSLSVSGSITSVDVTTDYWDTYL